MVRRILLVLAVFSLLLALVPSTLAQNQNEIARRRHLERILSMMSGRVMRGLADRLGVTNIQGKALIRPGRSGGVPSVTEGTNRAVGDSPEIDENEPSIAVNPIDPSKMVAAMHYPIN